MSPYEILQPGGSVEYNNEEAGAEWLQRLTQRLPEVRLDQPRAAGRVAVPAEHRVIQQLMNQRMFPLTLPGLEGAMRLLVQMTRCRRRCAVRAAVLLAALARALAAARACRSSARQDRRRPPSRRSADAERRAVRARDRRARRRLRTLLLELPRRRRASRTRRRAEAITPPELDRLVAAAPAQARSAARDRGLLQRRRDASSAATAPTACRACALDRRAGPARRWSRAVDDRGAPPLAPREATRERRRRDRPLEPAARAWPLRPGQPFRQPAWTACQERDASPRCAPTATRRPRWTRPTRRSTPPTTARRSRVDGRQRPAVPARRDPASRASSATTTSGGAPRSRPSVPARRYSEKLLLDYQERLRQGRPVRGRLGRARHRPGARRRRRRCVVQACKELTAAAGDGRRRLQRQHRAARLARALRTAARSACPGSRTNKFELGPDLKSLGAELTSYPLETMYRNLLRRRTASSCAPPTRCATVVARRASAARSDTTASSALYYAEAVARARRQRALGDEQRARCRSTTTGCGATLDSMLLPTRGYTRHAQGALGYGTAPRARSTARTSDARGPFVRAYAPLHWYRPFGALVSATRASRRARCSRRAASRVPDPMLFRAGGDDSVRGYGYRTLGPTINGAVASGRVLLTGSVEIARADLARLPAVWWARCSSTPATPPTAGSELDPVLGYGVGVRWRSPVGPLRARPRLRPGRAPGAACTSASASRSDGQPPVPTRRKPPPPAAPKRPSGLARVSRLLLWALPALGIAPRAAASRRWPG